MPQSLIKFNEQPVAIRDFKLVVESPVVIHQSKVLLVYTVVLHECT